VETWSESRAEDTSARLFLALMVVAQRALRYPFRYDGQRQEQFTFE
jgi:hypothetical protein